MNPRPLLFALLLLRVACAAADPTAFDLGGPQVEVRVTRGGHTLPVSQVPNLARGDRLRIKADLPPSQSEHYLLVVAFLRGATNPPPTQWFFRCDTWSSRCPDGLDITVPEEAQQALVFLAPQTSGDFRTLVDAVRGRPGAFVRASQDLNQAGLDRSRLNAYLAAIHALNAEDPAKLKAATPLLARSLGVKVDDRCLAKVPELQAPCLTEGQESLILSDGHSASMVDELTNGPASDLALAAGSAAQMGAGYYSPYISSIIDIGRIFSSFRTAQYQYLPALASADGDRLQLALNAAPSFHDPKSVLVAALPAIQAPRLPPLHAVDPQQVYCARRDALVLPVEGAPLVFSTGFVHDVVLSLSGGGVRVDLPAHADPVRGGFVIDTSALQQAPLASPVQASLHGQWGFDDYQAPDFQLVDTRVQTWAVPGTDTPSLVVGRERTVHLSAGGAGSVGCVDKVVLRDAAGKQLAVSWKAVRPDTLEMKLPLQDVEPGVATLLVSQYGGGTPQPVPLAVVDVPRPQVTLLAHSIRAARGAATHIQLRDTAQLPQDAVLTFSVRAQSPTAFSREAKLEIATADGVWSTELSLANGGMTLVNDSVAVGRLDPAKAFGPSAFGPLRLRAVGADGVKGPWQPLVTLVRLPQLQQLECPAEGRQSCRLSGGNLFLLDSVAADARFDDPVTVPEGYPDDGLEVPRPKGGRLYLKLRDDPAVINVATLAPQAEPAAVAAGAAAAASAPEPVAAQVPAAGAPGAPAAAVPAPAIPALAAPANGAPEPDPAVQAGPAPAPAAASAPAASTSAPAPASAPDTPAAPAAAAVPAVVAAPTPGPAPVAVQPAPGAAPPAAPSPGGTAGG